MPPNRSISAPADECRRDLDQRRHADDQRRSPSRARPARDRATGNDAVIAVEAGLHQEEGEGEAQHGADHRRPWRVRLAR